MFTSLLDIGQVLVGVFVGFCIPGWTISLCLRSPARFVSTFIISLLVLFHTVFWLGVAGVELNVLNVGGLLVLLSGVLLWVTRSRLRQALAIKDVAWPSRSEWILVAICLAVATTMLVSCILQPLAGWDTVWRWNFLALAILKHGRFDYYPPLTSDDFRHYFYVDGIPPLVSFAYFWMYAIAQRFSPLAAGVFTFVQFAVICQLCFRMVRFTFPEAKGWIALSLLLTSPIFFWAVHMGQETGLTAISLLGILYFIANAAPGRDPRAMVLAGSAAALGALSREYGCAFVLCGVVACCWKKQDLSATGVFCLVAIGLAAPWYVRNWIDAGNPFYSNPVGHLFAVNPVHVAVLTGNKPVFTIAKLIAKMHDVSPLFLAMLAGFPLAVGAMACFVYFRRHGHLVFSCMVVGCLWAYSVPQTAGGLVYSMRVLSPMLVLLAILGAGPAMDLMRRPPFRGVSWVLLVAAGLYSAAQGPVMPVPLMFLTPSDWIELVNMNRPDLNMNASSATLELPKGARVLSSSAYLFAAMADTDKEVVPIWSPEVAFLYDESRSASEAAEMLRAAGIHYVFGDYQDMHYLQQFPFFAELPDRVVPVSAESPRGFLFISPSAE